MTEDIIYTVATVENMRQYEHAHPRTHPKVEPRRAMALDIRTGATFSASSGDYWMHNTDAPITNRYGEPLLLVTEHTIYRDALTGRLVE